VIVRGDRARFLRFDPVEHPVALQLGGCENGGLAGFRSSVGRLCHLEALLSFPCHSYRG